MSTFVFGDDKIGAEVSRFEGRRYKQLPAHHEHDPAWKVRAARVGHMFFAERKDTKTIADEMGLLESTVYSLLIEFRQKRERAL